MRGNGYIDYLDYDDWGVSYVNTQQIVYFKHVQFIIYQLYPNKLETIIILYTYIRIFFSFIGLYASCKYRFLSIYSTAISSMPKEKPGWQ